MSQPTNQTSLEMVLQKKNQNQITNITDKQTTQKKTKLTGIKNL